MQAFTQGDLAISKLELFGVFMWLEHPSIDTRNVRSITSDSIILILDVPWVGYIFNDSRPINYGSYYPVLIEGQLGWIKEDWIVPFSEARIKQSADKRFNSNPK